MEKDSLSGPKLVSVYPTFFQGLQFGMIQIADSFQ